MTRNQEIALAILLSRAKRTNGLDYPNKVADEKIKIKKIKKTK